MPVKDVIIRAQELGGRIVSLGSDSARGITVEDLNCDADTWGPRSCSFTLRRNPKVPWPDIGAFAPLEIESQGLPVWSGRVKGTPTTDGSDRRITVNGEGWQYHLDDDSYQRIYVLTDMTRFVDSRSLVGANLVNLKTGAAVQVGAGAVQVSFPKTYAGVNADAACATLDFGPSGMGIARAIFQYIVPAGASTDAAVRGHLRANDSQDGINVVGDDLADFTVPAYAASSGSFQGGNTTVGRRYLHFFVVNTNAGPVTFTVDQMLGMAKLYVASDTTYLDAASPFDSLLKASDVVKDALAKATLLLSASVANITATTFKVPEFAMSKPDTPRNVINAVNTYHNYQARVGVDRVFEYRARPANATIQVDGRSAFDEASAGDASEIYSGVIVSYTAADGSPGSLTRSQPGSIYTASSIQPTNPGAEVNTANWSSPDATIARTTTGGQFSAGVAGFSVTPPGAGWASAISSAWTGGTFTAGTTYMLSVDANAAAGPDTIIIVEVSVGSSIVATATVTGDGAFHTGQAIWVQPSSTTPTITIRCNKLYYFDNLILSESAATVVNRRGFRRTFTLDTNMSLTPAAAQQIGDVFLTQHKTTPLKGKVVCTGYGAARKTPSGVNMPTAELLLNTGELVRLGDTIDPDTGNIGREGRIASVSWDALSDTSTLELDSQVENFEAFLGRLGILTGAVK